MHVMGVRNDSMRFPFDTPFPLTESLTRLLLLLLLKRREFPYAAGSHRASARTRGTLVVTKV